MKCDFRLQLLIFGDLQAFKYLQCMEILKHSDIGWRSQLTYQFRNGTSTTCSGGDWTILLSQHIIAGY